MLCDLDLSMLHFCGANAEEAIEMQHPTLVKSTHYNLKTPSVAR